MEGGRRMHRRERRQTLGAPVFISAVLENQPSLKISPSSLPLCLYMDEKAILRGKGSKTKQESKEVSILPHLMVGSSHVSLTKQVFYQYEKAVGVDLWDSHYEHDFDIIMRTKQVFYQYQKAVGVDLWDSHYEAHLQKLKELN
ncbi:MADS box transcription factor, partial [Striga asiatica]